MSTAKTVCVIRNTAPPGSDKWQRISWDEAFNRIARLMKADRDANFIEKNEQGVTVNRWLSTGMLCASAASNETGMLTQNLCDRWVCWR